MDFATSVSPSLDLTVKYHPNVDLRLVGSVDAIVAANPPMLIATLMSNTNHPLGQTLVYPDPRGTVTHAVAGINFQPQYDPFYLPTRNQNACSDYSWRGAAPTGTITYYSGDQKLAS